MRRKRVQGDSLDARLLELMRAAAKKYKIGYAWSKEEESRVRELYETGTPILEIANITGRSVGGIRSRLKRLGLPAIPARVGKIWTEFEDEQLIEWAFEGKTRGEIAALLGRSSYAVFLRLWESASHEVSAHMRCSLEEAREMLHLPTYVNSDREQRMQELIFTGTTVADIQRVLRIRRKHMLNRMLYQQVSWIRDTFQCSRKEAKQFVFAEF